MCFFPAKARSPCSPAPARLCVLKNHFLRAIKSNWDLPWRSSKKIKGNPIHNPQMHFLNIPSHSSLWTPTHLHTCSPAHLHTCTPTHLHTCTLAHLLTCTPACLHTYTPAHLPTCAPVYLRICTPTHLPTCAPAHLWLPQSALGPSASHCQWPVNPDRRCPKALFLI